MFAARPILTSLALLAAAAAAAAPTIGVRSVTNGVSLADGPAGVPRGGILAIRGEALAAEHVAADSLPLPLELGNPAVEVLVNGTAAPLFFVSPTQINAQVPWEVEAGRASVVVREGDTESATAYVLVTDLNVTLIRHGGTRSPIVESAATPTEPPVEPTENSAPIALGSPGEAPAATGVVLDADAAISPGSVIRVFAAGIGETTPAIATGAAAAADTTYELALPQRAFLGGLPVENLSVEPSTELVGVYQMTFGVPALAESTEVFRWISGDQGEAGVMGPGDAPTVRYMRVPEGVTSAARIDVSDLNPYFVSVSEPLDEEEGCYAGVHLLDFRRKTTTTLSDCLFPSYPNAATLNQYRPFEAPVNSAVLAALVAPAEPPAAGLSDQLLLVDTASGTTETVTVEGGADRLQTGQNNSSTLRLERPGGEAGRVVVDLSGTVVGDAGNGPGELPEEVDGLSVNLAAGNLNWDGYRLRFWGPAAADSDTGPQAILFDGTGAAVAKAPFPEGWAPIAPPRRSSPNGNFAGGPSLAPSTGGFGGETSAYVVMRKTDNSRDGVAAFQVTLPDPAADPPADASAEAPAPAEPVATIAVTAIEFPEGVHAASCNTQVRWLRVPATRTLAIAGAGQPFSEFAEPRDGQICASDRLLLFDPAAAEVSQVMVADGERLDFWIRGAANGYLYFGDATREVPLTASTKIHVFDAATGQFTQIAFPDDGEGNPVGIPYNNQLTQVVAGDSKLLALATVGGTRTNPRGITVQPFAGNAGLLVVDLEQGTARHLPLPEGYARIEPGNNGLVQQGRRGFGMMPLTGRAFANARLPGQGAGTAIVTWDLATGEPTVIELPDEEAFVAVRPLGGRGANQRPFLWDFSPNSGSVAFGVYNSGRDLIGVAVVGP